MRLVAALVALAFATGAEAEPRRSRAARLEEPLVRSTRRYRPTRPPPRNKRYASPTRVRPMRPARLFETPIEEELPLPPELMAPLEPEPELGPPPLPPTTDPVLSLAFEPPPPTVASRVPWPLVHKVTTLAATGLLAANLLPAHLHHADTFLGANTQRFSGAHHGLEVAGHVTAALSAGAGWMDLEERSTLHSVALSVAGATLATQLGLLAATDARDGYSNQRSVSRAHLVFAWLGVGAMAATSWSLFD
jgi:hypothetical protein